MSCSSRIEWLINSKFSYLLDTYKGTIAELKKLARSYDNSGCSTTGLMLENHYSCKKKTGISFYSDDRILGREAYEIEALNNAFMVNLRHARISTHFNLLGLEYDSTKLGYRLAGAFFSSRFQYNFLQESNDGLENLLGIMESPDRFYSGALDALMRIIEDLGEPQIIGIMARSEKIIKYVVKPSKATKVSLSSFLDKYFADVLDSLSISSVLLATFIVDKSEGLNPRLSIDYNIEKSSYLPRVGFELSPDYTTIDHVFYTYLLKFLSFLPEGIRGLDQCLQLAEAIPYGEKMPSIMNLCGSRKNQFKSISITLSHFKLSLMNSVAEMKSYVHLTETIRDYNNSLR